MQPIAIPCISHPTRSLPAWQLHYEGTTRPAPFSKNALLLALGLGCSFNLGRYCFYPAVREGAAQLRCPPPLSIVTCCGTRHQALGSTHHRQPRNCRFACLHILLKTVVSVHHSACVCASRLQARSHIYHLPRATTAPFITNPWTHQEEQTKSSIVSSVCCCVSFPKQ